MMKLDERFATPRSSARRGYSSGGSEDERFLSPRTSARSVSSDDANYRTPRESSQSQSQVDTSRVSSNSNSISSTNSSISKTKVRTTSDSDYYYQRAMGKPASASASSRRQEDPKQSPLPLAYAAAPPAPENDIFSAARHNRIDSVAYMLDQGISVHSEDPYGNTILSIACQNGLKRMTKLALRRGANINNQNHRGNTALHFCYAYGYGDTLGEYLLSKGADATLANDDGLLCFHGIDPRSPRK